MQTIRQTSAGLDVHKRSVTACALKVGPKGKIEKTTRTFTTMTHEILNMGDWLRDQGVRDVAMESTGVYWKPIWNLLEDDFNLMLCNARHIKNVPGRKSDVKDSEWIAHLHLCGLLRASFVPCRPHRELRDLTRQHCQLTGEKTRAINRVHKILEDANIKLASVATDIMGKSGRDMIQGLIEGDTDSRSLAELARSRMRSKIPELREALFGHVSEHHRFMLEELMGHIKFLEERLEAMDSRINLTLSLLDSKETQGPSTKPRLEEDAPEQLNLEEMERDEKGKLTQPLGFHQSIALLDEIPGCGPQSLKLLLAEIGTDMRRFPDEQHFSSWAKISPGLNESAGKRKSSRIGKGNRWLRRILTEMAWAASRGKNTYFKAFYRRLAQRRGPKRALIALGHSLLVTIYHMLAYGRHYQDLGPDWFDQRNPERVKKHCLKRLEKIGYMAKLTPLAEVG